MNLERMGAALGLSGVVFLLGQFLLGLFAANLGYIALTSAVMQRESRSNPVDYEPPAVGNSSLFTKAEIYFRQSIHWTPQSGQALAGLGQTLVREGFYPEAVEILEAAVQLSNPSRYGYVAGNAAMYAGNHKRALELWMIANKALNARWYLAIMISKQTRWDYHPERRGDAAYVLEETVRQNGISARTANFCDALADIYDQMREFEKSEHAIRAAVAAEPDNSAYRSRLAWVLMNEGKLDEALREAQAAIDIQPNWRGHFVRGSVFWQRCQLGDAIREFRAGLQLSSSGDYRFAWQIFYLGDTYWEQGRVSDAIQNWEKYLQFQPGHVAVREQIAQAKAGTLPRRCMKK